jgi:hypothetical protein
MWQSVRGWTGAVVSWFMSGLQVQGFHELVPEFVQPQPEFFQPVQYLFRILLLGQDGAGGIGLAFLTMMWGL